MSGVEQRERGFALLIVLWTLVLVALLISQLNAAGRTEAQLAGNLRDAARLEALADGAVYEAASRLLDPSDRHFAADGSSHEIRFGSATAEIRVTSETGKIDPNSASSDLLIALMREVGADARTAQSIAAAIVVWRYPDAQSQTDDAAATTYRASGRDYAPPRSAFQSINELGLVLGMTPELLMRLRPHLTVYHEGDPDLRVADPVVVAAVKSLGAAPANPPSDDRSAIVATVDVSVSQGTQSRFMRHAVIRVGPNQDGSILRILEWS